MSQWLGDQTERRLRCQPISQVCNHCLSNLHQTPEAVLPGAHIWQQWTNLRYPPCYRCCWEPLVASERIIGMLVDAKTVKLESRWIGRLWKVFCYVVHTSEVCSRCTCCAAREVMRCTALNTWPHYCARSTVPLTILPTLLHPHTSISGLLHTVSKKVVTNHIGKDFCLYLGLVGRSLSIYIPFTGPHRGSENVTTWSNLTFLYKIWHLV